MFTSGCKSRTLVGLLLASLLGGCAPLKLPQKIPLPGQAEKPQTPMKITALWTDTVLVEAGIAGFGGRIMFYGRNGEDPILVDGELTVFAYDDSEGGTQNTIPAKKYVFRSEELQKHYSKSTLGHSYSFWLPWAPIGGPRRQISLIARFKSKNAGGVVMSEMSKHLLPGTDDEPAVRPSGLTNPAPISRGSTVVKQASHEVAVTAETAGKEAMSTTTINLPPSLARLGDATGKGALANDPKANVATPASLKTPESSPPEPADSAALAREVRAARESVAAAQESQPADRFARRRFPARIAPKLPPTRDPVRLPQRPAGSPSGLGSTTPADSSSESRASSASASPNPRDLLPATVR